MEWQQLIMAVRKFRVLSPVRKPLFSLYFSATLSCSVICDSMETIEKNKNISKPARRRSPNFNNASTLGARDNQQLSQIALYVVLLDRIWKKKNPLLLCLQCKLIYFSYWICKIISLSIKSIRDNFPTPWSIRLFRPKVNEAAKSHINSKQSISSHCLLPCFASVPYFAQCLGPMLAIFSAIFTGKALGKKRINNVDEREHNVQLCRSS